LLGKKKGNERVQKSIRFKARGITNARAKAYMIGNVNGKEATKKTCRGGPSSERLKEPEGNRMEVDPGQDDDIGEVNCGRRVYA